MTPRERSLLSIFFIALGAAAVAVCADLYLERLTRLDSEFVELQKRALRAASGAAIARSREGDALLPKLKARFFAAGTLPDPLSLASRVQAALKSAGLAVSESRVSESSKSAQWISYRAEGGIESWFRFLRELRESDERALFRTISIVKDQGFDYSVSFEVGHAISP